MDNFTNICEATSQSHELDNYRSSHRKGKKLLAEKKRRARINHCLMQIRDIVCEGQEEKDTDLEKMEKAEILEKTLEVLTKLRHDYHSQTSSSFSTRKAMAVRYASGFSSCAEESIRYIQSSRLVPAEVKVQLQNHLRAITHRIETNLQGEGQGLNFDPSYKGSAVSSSSTEKLTALGDFREDTRGSSDGRVQEQISDTETYYTPSPIHFQSPGIQTHIPPTPSSPQPHQDTLEYERNTPEKIMKNNFYEHEIKCTDNIQNDTPDNNMLPQEHDTCSVFSKSLFQHQQSYNSGTTIENNVVNSFLSPTSTYPLSSPSFNDVTPSTNSPVILYSTPVISNTSTLSDQSVFSYHFYEAYPTVPSILVQPITYMASPLRQNHSPLSSVEKQPKTLNNALDLCVKRNVDHQISPETMWRPW